MKNVIKKTDGETGQEGLLGSQPETVTSVAELMLHDSDINVYDDNNVILPDNFEFNIRGKKQKVLSKKEKAKNDLMRKQILQRQRVKEEQEREKRILIEPAAPSIGRQQKGRVRRVNNELEFYRKNDEEVDLELAENLNIEGDVGDFELFE